MELRVARDRIAGMVGNFLEQYDNALFGLLSPFIAPLFFEGKDPITALILTYSMLPLGLITRPLGSLVFGWIGDSIGRRQALFLSLTGMGLITVSMGCLPLYKDIGPWSPFLLALCRMFQGFFAAGEVAGGAIFVLERTPRAERSFVSSFYDASSIGGILLASAFVTLMASQGLIEEEWRYLFWTAGATAILGMVLRWKSSNTEWIEAMHKTTLRTGLGGIIEIGNLFCFNHFVIDLFSSWSFKRVQGPYGLPPNAASFSMQVGGWNLGLGLGYKF